MIDFRPLPDHHQDLTLSPMFRAASVTLGSVLEQGSIGLIATKAFKRDFVHWPVEHFQWPGKTAEDMFRYNKVVNEVDFPPLELLHFLLIRLRLGRHYKGNFRATNNGRMYAGQPGALFEKLVPFFLLAMDHAAYSRTGKEALGNWDIWFSVMNVAIENGLCERELYGSSMVRGRTWTMTARGRSVRSVLASRSRWNGLGSSPHRKPASRMGGRPT